MTLASTEKSKFPPALRLFVASAIFAIAVMIVFGDVLFSDDRIVSAKGTDIWRQFYGWRQFGFGELAKGHLALWNPYIFCGAPYLGGFQSALLYPPNWLYLLLPLAVAINVGVALHVFLSGVFMYCWAAYRRLHWLACVSAGLIFMLGGPQMGQLQAGHLPNACALIWAPLIFLAVDDLIGTGSIRAIFLGSAAVGLQILAGHPQYVFFTAVGASLYLLLQLSITSHRRKAIGGFFILYLFGALLAAAQLFTGLQATSEAMRTKLSIDFVSTFSFPPEDLLTMVLPRFFGDVVNSPYWGRWFYWEMSAFVGMTAVVLASFAVAVPRRQRRFGFTMLGLILLLALGKYTPLGQVIFRLPGFESFRGISKFMFLFLMFVAMLAAQGFHWLLREGVVKRWFFYFLSGLAVLFIVAAITITLSARAEWAGWWGQIIHSDNWAYNNAIPINEDLLQKSAAAAATDLWWAAGACIAIGGLILAGRRYPRARWGLALVLAAELVLFARGVHSNFEVADLKKMSAIIDANFGDKHSDARIWTDDQGAFLADYRYNSDGDDPMELRRYTELMAATFGMTPEQLMMEMPSNYKDLSAPAWKLTRTAYLFISFNGRMLYHPNPHTILPRAVLIGDVTVEPDQAKMLDTLADRVFDPSDRAIVESPLIPAPSGDYELGHAEVQDIDSDTLEIEASANASCLLLITDAYAKGWQIQAMPDSSQQTYEVVPADLAFRGVPLQAGTHHFRMVYRPWGFIVGKWTSIAAILFYLLAIGWFAFASVRCIPKKQKAIPVPT